MGSELEEMPIPPLEPTWYGERVFGSYELHPWSATACVQEVVFKMSFDEYKQRMKLEMQRLERERHIEEVLRHKTDIIRSLADQVKQLQTARMPSVAALRQAYAEDVINLEEFDRLVMHCIAGAS